MLFLLLIVATTTITTLGTDGQIPFGGRAESESTKTITATIVTATEPNNEIPFEISDYLLAFISVINQFKF